MSPPTKKNLQNYSAAFMGNRQMANANTEQIFKNRDSLIRTVKVEPGPQKNCQQALLNQSKVDYLEHRSKLNSRVAGVSDKMSTINRRKILRSISFSIVIITALIN